MNEKILTIAVSGVFLMTATAAKAADDEKVTLEAGADVVSSYIWRGYYCGSFSIQPTAAITWNRPSISLGAWASAELLGEEGLTNMKEFDLSLAWAPTEALSIGLTDYHFCNAPYWSDWNFSGGASHYLEVNLGYDFGPLALAWNTCLTGNDYNEKGDRAYSSYFEVSAPFKVGDVECSGAVGVLPWEDSFTSGGANHGLNVCNVSLSASKEVAKLPLSAQVTFNPQKEETYFVVGLHF